MRKDFTTAKLTDLEIEGNKILSKSRYIVEQYFGISHLHNRAKKAFFTTIMKSKYDCWYRQVYPVKFEEYLTGAAFNITKGLKMLKLATALGEHRRPVGENRHNGPSK